jgi:phage gp45-like
MKFLSPLDVADRHGNSASRMPMQTVDDTQLHQETKLNGFSGEQMDTIEHIHPYGFTAVPQPPTGEGEQTESAEGMTMFMGSNRTHGITVVMGDRRFRLYKLAGGEVAMHDDQGQQVHFKRDGLYGSVPNSKKITMQVMADDTLPQDGNKVNGQTLGQIQQAGRSNVSSFVMDKNNFTVTVPGTIQFNAANIITNGMTYLGGPDAHLQCALLGTIDTGGYSDIGELATKVLVK